jgi:hypothetical protein
MIRKMVRFLLFQPFAFSLKTLLCVSNVTDLSHFLLILAVFLMTFGVTIESILSQHARPTVKVFKSILSIAYWPIYGHIDLLETLDKCQADTTNCENLKEVNVIHVLLMIYMLIACVLLIAMFRYHSVSYKQNST